MKINVVTRGGLVVKRTKHSLKKMSDEWYERMKRPGVAENYARYRDAMEKDHSGNQHWFNRGEKMEFRDGHRV